MGQILLPSRFNQQPQQAAPIDRSNPLANGLVHCWGLNVIGSLRLIDSVGVANGTFGSGNAGTTGNSWQAGPNGYYINYNDGGTGTVTSVALAVGDSGGSGSPGANTFTFLKRLRLSTLTNQPGTGTALALYASGPSGSTGGIEIRVDSSTGKIQLLRQALELVAESTGTVPVGVDSVVGVSYDNSTARFYINGVPAGITAAASKTFTLTRQYYLGYADLAAAERLPNDSRIYRADVWNRALSPAEVALWGSNPWQVFKAPQRRLWNSLVAVGTVNGTLASSEGQDASAGSGAVSSTSVSGALAQSEGADTFVAAGATTSSTVTGTLARSEGGDTTTGAGTVAFVTITGTGTASEGADTAQASGSIGNAAMGTLSRQEGADTLTAVGAVVYPAITASLARQETPDSLVASGSLLFAITGMMAAIELPDTLKASSPAPAAPKLNLYTTMRDSPVNVSIPLGAPVNLAGTMLPTVINLYTTMRIPAVNMTGNLGAPVNITGNLL